MFVYVQNFLYLCKVKRKHADIDRMVMESHYLEGLERESSPSLVRPAWAYAIGCKSRTSPDSGNR